MEANVNLPKSVRKYIRREKSRLRREFSNPVELQNKTMELYARFGIKKYK